MYALNKMVSTVHELVAMCIPQAQGMQAECEQRYLCCVADMAGLTWNRLSVSSES